MEIRSYRNILDIFLTQQGILTCLVMENGRPLPSLYIDGKKWTAPSYQPIRAGLFLLEIPVPKNLVQLSLVDGNHAETFSIPQDLDRPVFLMICSILEHPAANPFLQRKLFTKEEDGVQRWSYLISPSRTYPLHSHIISWPHHKDYVYDHFLYRFARFRSSFVCILPQGTTGLVRELQSLSSRVTYPYLRHGETHQYFRTSHLRSLSPPINGSGHAILREDFQQIPRTPSSSILDMFPFMSLFFLGCMIFFFICVLVLKNILWK